VNITIPPIDPAVLVKTFDDERQVREYLLLSGDTGKIHVPSRKGEFYDEHSAYLECLKEHPAGRLWIPGILVAAPAVGIFRHCFGKPGSKLFEGFLLSETMFKCPHPVFSGDTVHYVPYAPEEVRRTKQGFWNYVLIGYGAKAMNPLEGFGDFGDAGIRVIEFMLTGFVHESFRSV